MSEDSGKITMTVFFLFYYISFTTWQCNICKIFCKNDCVLRLTVCSFGEKKKGKKSSEEKSGRNFLPFGSQEKIEKKNRGCESFLLGPQKNFYRNWRENKGVWVSYGKLQICLPLTLFWASLSLFLFVLSNYSFFLLLLLFIYYLLVIVWFKWYYSTNHFSLLSYIKWMSREQVWCVKFYEMLSLLI